MASFLRAANRFGRAVVGHPVIDRIARPLWCALSSLVPLDLTYSDATHWISLELTSRCNLRCVYCGKSWDKAESKRVYDFPEEWIAPSMKTLKRRGLLGVISNGIGESTLREGWQAICRTFHESGLNLTIISNFARPMTAEDVAGMFNFDSIQVSVDTSDPALFSRLRRGGKLENVLANIDKVRKQAASEKLTRPQFRFDIVVADKTVHGLEGVVRVGLEHGVSDFYFANLYKGGDVPGDFNVNSVVTLPREELAEGLACLERAIALAKSAGCSVECHPGLIESMRGQLERNSDRAELFSIIGSTKSWGAPKLGKGMTRDCADPWKYANLCAQGEVRPCCAYEYAIGDLREQPLEDILNSAKVRGLRRDLLDGNLQGHLCEHCSMRPEIPVKEFRRRMKGRLVLYSLRRRVLNLFQLSAKA